MIQGLYLTHAELLWALPFVLAAGLLYLRRGKDRTLVASRTAVICLLILALANPYMIASHMESSKRPRIIVLDDRTESMAVFPAGVGEELKDAILDSQIRVFSGNFTPLGEEIVRNAPQGDAILLASDGYSNRGMRLEESLALARSSNVTVFALRMEPAFADSSVEISGTNTAVLGGDYPFTVIVRSAGGPPGGGLAVFADGERIYDQPLYGENTTSIKIPYAFRSVGSHILRAVISPAQDLHRANNEYQKAVYVVPKPNVLLITEEASSPLSEVLAELYSMTIEDEPPKSLEGYKAIVLANRPFSPEMGSLVDYVRDGGGLVVVGGMTSYELGGYLNSTLEQVLPVKSRPSTFKGGKTMVVVLDISGSMQQQVMGDGTPYLDYEKALALELLRSPEFSDYLVGVVVFGTKAYVVSGPMPLARSLPGLEEKIVSLWPSGTEETHMDDGMNLAWDMLNSSTGEGEIILFSDGRLTEDVFLGSKAMLVRMDVNTTLIQVQAFLNAPSKLRSLAEATGSKFFAATYPSALTVHSGEIQTTEEEAEQLESATGYGLSVLAANHYITAGLNLSANITGFNDVTPRPGAQRLVVMADGKPVLTSWRYGLGRVVSLSTDDGNRWASSLYSAENSVVISSSVNWAIGDPRPKGERIDAPDAWEGSPAEITITSSSPPSVQGQSLQVERVGDSMYRAVLPAPIAGIYHLGEFSLAVNYPIELRDVGYNKELEKLILAFGGKVLSPDEARRSLVIEARKSSERTVQVRESRRDILLLLALAIFLLEVVHRRLKEVRRKSPPRRP